MHNPVASRNRFRFRAPAALAIVATFALTACSSSAGSGDGKYGFKEAKQASSAQITVWIDSTRQPAADAYKKAFPNDPVKVVTYDGEANGSGSFNWSPNPAMSSSHSADVRSCQMSFDVRVSNAKESASVDVSRGW